MIQKMGGKNFDRGGFSKFPLVCLVFIFSLCCLVRAQDGQDYRFTLDIGNRWMPSFGGSTDLYRSHLDYGRGPKLFSSNFSMSTLPGTDRFFDRLDVEMNSWGGEPYNTARVRLGKQGLYEMRFDYQNVQYFNAIPFFANPFFQTGNLQTQHKFDISQRLSRFEITLRPDETISPFFAYERVARQGPLRTTIAADGDEFLVRQDVENRSDEIRGGINLKLTDFSLVLEQGFRWYQDRGSYESAGFPTGNSTRPVLGRQINLEDYRAETDFQSTVPFSNATAIYQPVDSLRLRGKISYSMAEFDPRFAETFSGNFFSFPLRSFYSGGEREFSGEAKQPSLFGDFMAQWQPWSRLRIVERFNIRRFHVSGSLLANSTFLNVDPVLEQGIVERLQTSNPFNTFLSLDLDSQEIQGIFFLTSKAALRVGHRFEHKEAELEETFSWNRHVLISGFSYDFSSGNRVAADFELGRTSDPIFRLDPVDFEQLRVRGSFSPLESLQFNGSMTLFDHDDDLEGIDFTSRSRDYTIQFTYAPLRRFSITGEYERTDIDTNLLFIVPQTFLSSRSIFEERGDYATLFLSFLLPRDVTLDVGYTVWGTVGNFPISYHQPVLRAEIPLEERVSAYVQWNFYDYNEKLRLFPQDYRTHLLLAGFRFLMQSE